MERVREIATANQRDWDPSVVKTLLPGLEPRLRASPLVHSMHTLCAHDKTQLRFWLPAQWFQGDDETATTSFEEFLKQGLLVCPRVDDDDDWCKDALRVECCIICSVKVTDLASANVVRAAFRVFPQCAQCARVFDNTAEVVRNVCSRCRVPFYCGEECQRAHWPVHKDKCQLMAPSK